VSPWSYERIQRWNRDALDPNRFYLEDSPVEECAAVISLLKSLNVDEWTACIDLHETTDTDESEFHPAKASRDGQSEVPDDGCIPDGFYLIGDIDEMQSDWHKAMIDAVREVTHIGESDEENKLVGIAISQVGVCNSKAKGKGKGVIGIAKYKTTTEVYPDSKTRPVSGQICNKAQMTCVVAGLDFIAKEMKLK